MQVLIGGQIASTQPEASGMRTAPYPFAIAPGGLQ
jgi:hypothetical protein